MPVHPPRRSLTSAELRTWRDFIDTVHALRFRLDGRLQSSRPCAGDYRVRLARARRTATEGLLRASAVIGWNARRLPHHLGRMIHEGGPRQPRPFAV